MSSTLSKAVKIADLLLSAIDKAADGYLYLDYCYRYPSKVFYADYEFSKSSLRSSVHRLNAKGLIEKQINEDKVILKLTEAGKDWILEHADDETFVWDGLWRIVIFDIPESHRSVRKILRDRLKTWGFVPWQKSVFAGRKPLTDKIRKLVKELKIDDWVLVIESANTGK